jgi:hypothetical protein
MDRAYGKPNTSHRIGGCKNASGYREQQLQHVTTHRVKDMINIKSWVYEQRCREDLVPNIAIPIAFR